MTKPTFSDLQNVDAARLAVLWRELPRSERRAIVRFWYKAGLRPADTFGNAWRIAASAIATATPKPQ